MEGFCVIGTPDVAVVRGRPDTAGVSGVPNIAAATGGPVMLTGAPKIWGGGLGEET